MERANKTLQDRLVKELRLRGIDSLAAGNAMLPSFMADYNARFAKPPRDLKDLHRPLAPGEDPDELFAWREERTVSSSLTLQYDKVLFLLEPTPLAKSLKRKRVTVADYPDGRLTISHGGVDLPYRVFFDKVSQVHQADIVENKRLGAVLAHIRAEQQKADTQRESAETPQQGRRPLQNRLKGKATPAAAGHPPTPRVTSVFCVDNCCNSQKVWAVVDGYLKPG